MYRVINELGEDVKFVMKPEQERMYHKMHTFNNILKSRQHGFTTLFCLIMLDACIFNSNVRAGVVAHEQKKAQEIFQDKVKWPYLQLPDFLRTTRKAEKMDGGELRLSNNSAIRVSTSMRSGTLHFLLISEHGKLCAKYPKRALELKTGTLPTVHEGGVIWNESTAEGPAGDFHDMAVMSQTITKQAEKEGRQLGPLEWKFHFFPWYKNPLNQTEPTGIKISDELHRYFDELQNKGIELTDRQKAWYSLTKDGPTGLHKYMKREHPSTPEEAFEQSVEGAVYGDEMELVRDEGRVGFYPWDASCPVYTFWDLGYRDATCVIFAQFIRSEIRIIDFYSMVGRGAAYHTKQVNSKDYVYKDKTGESTHYAPHDVMNHEKGTGIILKDTYESLGIKFNVVDRPALKSDGIDAVRNIFNSILFNADKTKELTKALSFYRYEWDGELLCFKKEPIHDWSSDPADALQTLALQYRFGKLGGEHIGYPQPIPVYQGAVREEQLDDYDIMRA